MPGGEPDIILDFAGLEGPGKLNHGQTLCPVWLLLFLLPTRNLLVFSGREKGENKTKQNSNALGFITVSEMQSISFSASGHFFFPPAGLTFDKCWAVCGRASGGERWCIGMERLQDKQPVI